ncbi:hypothetical protein FDP41_011843 [Naegleria fowleri]|uniref:Autophagy-related protein 101 n=1 Tax=Naegleria fowleri TaxID=5763 RepID=A0A6A5C5A8_NAEFO|nr:uncharacterized protein FDP41_011843 [Naegleria fowleri]KAF0981982.1 hypothetical protein FDP41_011843 [Naegleria fowleri]
MNRKVHNSQELNIQLPLVVPDHKHKGKLLFSDQTLIIKDCIKSILSTITFHRALGEIYPLGTDCEVLDQISYPSIDEKELNQTISQHTQRVIESFQNFLKACMNLSENFFSTPSCTKTPSTPTTNTKKTPSATPIIKLPESILYKSFNFEVKYYTLKKADSSFYSFFGGKREEKVPFESWNIPFKISWNTQWNHLFEGFPLVKVMSNEKESDIQGKMLNSPNNPTLPPDVSKLQEQLRKRLVLIIQSAHEDIPHLPGLTEENLSSVNGKSFPFDIVFTDDSRDDSNKRSTWLNFF